MFLRRQRLAQQQADTETLDIVFGYCSTGDGNGGVQQEDVSEATDLNPSNICPSNYLASGANAVEKSPSRNMHNGDNFTTLADLDTMRHSIAVTEERLRDQHNRDNSAELAALDRFREVIASNEERLGRGEEISRTPKSL
jgi:hypothetical protein